MTATDKNKLAQKAPRMGMVHFILSNTYIMFLVAVVLGAIFDMIFHVRIFTGMVYSYIGFVLIILGSLLIYWAQATSNVTSKDMQTKGIRDFDRGPYKYSRNPSYLGLIITILGLAFVVNSLSILVFLIIACVVVNFVFLREEEVILEERYGQAYLDYKKKVSTWV
jgi:protein-S-isoprenylcysteine O-methyltransferase Ste14